MEIDGATTSEQEFPRIRRVYFGAGVAWQICSRAYFLLLFYRVAVDLGFSPLQLVLMGTAKEVAILTMEIPTGVVADVYSRKWSVVIAYVVGGLAIAWSGLFDSFGLLLVSSALWGFALTFRSGAEIAWLTGEVGSTAIAERLVLRRASFEMGATIFGVIVATALAVATSTGPALAVFGTACVILGIILAFVMPETGFERVSDSRIDALRTTVRDGARAARRIRPLRILVIATVLAGFASEAVDRLYVRRFDDIGLTEQFDNAVIVVGAIAIGQALMALGALRIATRRIVAKRTSGTLATALGVLLAATSIGVATLATFDVLVVAAIGLVVSGAMRAASEPVKAAWANEHSPEASRATVQSFVGQAHSLGEITGGVVLGTIAALTGVPVALTVSALVYFAAGAVAVRFRPSVAAPG